MLRAARDDKVLCGLTFRVLSGIFIKINFPKCVYLKFL